MSRRLEVVQRLLRDALDAAPAGPIRLISMCAGDGRDVLGVLPSHRRSADVSATLVELDPQLAENARASATAARLNNLDVVVADAGSTDVYAGSVPAHIALVCGVFGNIADSDVRRTVMTLPCLCAPLATVIWTRGTFEPDLTPRIREWFAGAGFEEI
ncbi:MAG TPA: SAM-dependent methyltransferase, partial [Dehalococcoidia bacterium]|nr:SAM-dependent methyltransferase [Dehalococcoidia bacterium]